MDETITAIAIMGVLLLVTLTVAIIISVEHENVEKEMIAKCTPNPELFECQLYLAERGKRCDNGSGSMATGLATGLIIGQTTARN